MKESSSQAERHPGARFDPGREILAESGCAMNRKKITTDDEECSVCGVQGGKQISEVGTHAHRSESRRGTRGQDPTGTPCAREQSGLRMDLSAWIRAHGVESFEMRLVFGRQQEVYLIVEFNSSISSRKQAVGDYARLALKRRRATGAVRRGCLGDVHYQTYRLPTIATTGHSGESRNPERARRNRSHPLKKSCQPEDLYGIVPELPDDLTDATRCT